MHFWAAYDLTHTVTHTSVMCLSVIWWLKFDTFHAASVHAKRSY
jgi:hypothetical protein